MNPALKRDFEEVNSCLRRDLGYCEGCTKYEPENPGCDKYVNTKILKRTNDSRIMERF